jgi:hypothetical protein
VDVPYLSESFSSMGHSEVKETKMAIANIAKAPQVSMVRHCALNLLPHHCRPRENTLVREGVENHFSCCPTTATAAHTKTVRAPCRI